MQRMDKNIYSEHWEKETESLDSQGIYEALSKITPKENTIEIGCGTGVTSRHLASDRKILSIDNNEHLIEKASQTLKSMDSPPAIIHADVFELTEENLSSIRDFSPKVVTGWFIGSHADDIDKLTDSSLAIYEKPKLYRESIEDIIVGKLGAIDTVEWIHLANRGKVSAGATEQQFIQSTIGDYNTHVFFPNGYEVEEIKLLNWNRNGSDFMYVNSLNPNYMGGGDTCFHFNSSETKKGLTSLCTGLMMIFPRFNGHQSQTDEVSNARIYSVRKDLAVFKRIHS